MAWSDFTTAELAVGITISIVVCLGSPLGVGFIHSSVAGKAPEAPKLASEIPIAVQPVVDDLPLLKLGGKQMRPKLPDMWEVKPQAVKRFEESSAPSPDAKDDVKAIPTSRVVEGDAAAPPPDAEIAKEVDEDIKKMDAGETPEPTAEGEGSPDGVKEGTETDPLKARAVSLYRSRIAAWFNARFKQPTETVPCEVLGGLSASVAAVVGGDRSVTGFNISRPSGNAAFDARVQQTMQATIGQQLPPPPTNYPDILDTVVYPVFAGKKQQCSGTKAPDSTNPSAPSEPSTPESPAPGSPPGESPPAGPSDGEE